MDKTDNELMAEFAGCSIEAFNRIYERYKIRIYNFVFHNFLNDYDQSEEVVQKTFINVYKSKFKYQSTYKFSTWVYTIARNFSLNEIKRNSKKKNTNRNSSIDEIQEIPTEEDLFNEIVKKDYNGLLLKMLDKLQPIYREVMIMRYMEDLTYSEISKITGVTEATLRSRAMRGLELFNKILKETNLEIQEFQT